MNNAALKWAISMPLPMRDKMVLTVLVAHADAAGYSAPSIATLAAAASACERSVRAAINALATAGLIVISRGGGRSMTNIYQIQTPQTATQAEATPANYSNTRQTTAQTPQTTAFCASVLPSPLPPPSPTPPFPPIPPLTTPTPSPPITPTIPHHTASARDDLFGGKAATPLPSKPKPEPGERGSGQKAQVPENWHPGAAGMQFAADHGINAKVEAPRFVDNHRAKGNTFADIAAAWRTWCRSPYATKVGMPRASPIRKTAASEWAERYGLAGNASNTEFDIEGVAE